MPRPAQPVDVESQETDYKYPYNSADHNSYSPNPLAQDPDLYISSYNLDPDEDDYFEEDYD